MANDKFYTRKKTINGVEYTAQFSGLACAIEAIDSSYIEGSSNISTAKLANYLFNNVIVEPKGLKIDDFDNVEEFNEVTSWARDVMQGKFRNKPDASATKEKGEK